MNDYATAKGADLKKAEEIFRGLGFTKDKDGIWVTPNGTRLEFSCLYIPMWWATLADAFVAQMARIGIKINLVGTTWDPYTKSLWFDHDYDMYLRFGCWYNIHPYTSMYNIFVGWNTWYMGMVAPYPLHDPQVVDAPEWVADWIVTGCLVAIYLPCLTVQLRQVSPFHTRILALSCRVCGLRR